MISRAMVVPHIATFRPLSEAGGSFRFESLPFILNFLIGLGPGVHLTSTRFSPFLVWRAECTSTC